MRVRGKQASGSRFIILIGWVLAIAMAACKIDDRSELGVVVPRLDPAPDGGAAGGAGARLGAACVGGAECGSGVCVDGVCCDTPCKEVCASCAAPGSEGICSPVPQDELCARVACAAGTECRGVDTSQAGLNCAGVGLCRREAECLVASIAAGTPCQNETGTCTGDGACAVPGKLLLGNGCASDEDCSEGHCVPNAAGVLICCGGACDGECQQCSDAGHCEAAPAGDPRCLPVTCPVDNVCRDYAGDLAADLCRGFGSCANSLDCTFSPTRPESDCSCDEAGNCSLVLGRACTGAAECASQACVGTAAGSLVCCATACEGGRFCREDGAGCVECSGSQVSCDGAIEQRCGADGVLGATPCEFGCTPGQGCNALPAVGLPCADGRCIEAATCQADVAGVPRCCARDCAAEGRVCAENGSCVCSAEQVAAGDACLLRSGDPCVAGSECEAGQCVDGVCCQEACGAACERCEAGTGLCVADAAGQADAQCAAGSDCSGERGACLLRTGEVCTAPEACGTGLCEAAVSGGLRCCAADCAAPLACATDGSACVECEAAAAASCGNGCDAKSGACNPLRPTGAACAVSAQCEAPGGCLVDIAGVSRCCEANCAALGKVCSGGGLCVCAANQVEMAGQCLKVSGQVCAAAAECSTGACELVVGGGNRRCCADDCPATALCAVDGSECIDQRGAVGARCTANADCQNGNCADGVCCADECADCQRCELGSGGCEPDPSAACTLSSGVAGDCNEDGECVDPGAGAGQPCGVRSCQAGLTCTGGLCCQSACDGPCESGCGTNGLCLAPQTDPECGAVVCPEQQCQSSVPQQTNRSCIAPGLCSTENPCSPPVDVTGACVLAGGGAGVCLGGECSAPPLAGPGEACVVSSDCNLGNCFNGICCSEPCSGSCFTCQEGTGACAPLPIRSACDTSTSGLRLCDLFGECLDPVIQCSGANLGVAEEACCNAPLAGTHVEVAFTPAACLDVLGAAMFCDDDDDCRLGLVCARDGAAGGTRCVPPGPTAEGRICGNPRFGFGFFDCDGLRCDITPTASEDVFIPLPLDWASCFP